MARSSFSGSGSGGSGPESKGKQEDGEGWNAGPRLPSSMSLRLNCRVMSEEILTAQREMQTMLPVLIVDFF